MSIYLVLLFLCAHINGGVCVDLSFDNCKTDELKDLLEAGTNQFTRSGKRTAALLVDSTKSMEPMLILLNRVMLYFIGNITAATDVYTPFILCKYAEVSNKQGIPTPIIWIFTSRQQYYYLQATHLDIERSFGEAFLFVKETPLDALNNHLLPHLSWKSEVILITNSANDMEFEFQLPESIRGLANKKAKMTIFQSFDKKKNIISFTSYVFNFILGNLNGMLFNVDILNVMETTWYVTRMFREKQSTVAYVQRLYTTALTAFPVMFRIDKSMSYVQIRVTFQANDPINIWKGLHPYMLIDISIIFVALFYSVGIEIPFYKHRNTFVFEYNITDPRMYTRWTLTFVPLLFPINPFIEVLAEGSLNIDFGFSFYATNDIKRTFLNPIVTTSNLMLLLFIDEFHNVEKITSVRLIELLEVTEVIIPSWRIVKDHMNSVHVVRGFHFADDKEYCMVVTGNSNKYGQFERRLTPCIRKEKLDVERIHIDATYFPNTKSSFECRIETSRSLEARLYVHGSTVYPYKKYEVLDIPIFINIFHTNPDIKGKVELICEIKGGQSQSRTFFIPIDGRCSDSGSTDPVDKCSTVNRWKGLENYVYQPCPDMCFTELILAAGVKSVMIEFEKLSLVQSNPATLACNPLESLQIKIDKITKTVCGNLTGKQIMFETIGVKKILMATRIKLFKINIFQYTCKKDFQKQCSRLAVKPDGCACDFKGGDSCLHCCNRYTKKCSSRCSPPDLNDQDCVMYPLKPGCPCDSQNNCAECASKKAFSSSLAICDHCPAGPAPLHCSCEVHECKKPLTCVNGICVPTCTGNKKDSLCHCKNNNECKSGVCKNDVCHKKCYSSVRQPGCPCNGPKFCASGICQDRKCVNKCNKKPLDLDCQCTEHQDCLPGSNCGITTGTCRTAKCDGAKNEVNCPCVDGDICQSGQCSQGVCKCEARGTMYCSCQSDTNCEQGLVCNEFTKSCQPDCSVLPAKRFCPCVAPSYCASNTCSKGKCLDNCAGTAVNCICGASCASHLVCDKGFCVNQCNVENLIGCPCASNSECVSGICLSGKCSDLQVCLKAPRHAGCACKRGGDCMQGTDCNDKICSYPVDDCRFTVRPPSCACRTDTDCASGRCVNGKCRICLGVGRPLNCDCDSPTECDINLRCMNKKCGSDCSKAPYGTGCPCNGHLNCRALLCESGTCSACSFRQGITGCPCSDPASCIQGLACNPATKMCDKDCTAKLKPPGCSCGMNVECASGTCGQNDVCTECITPKFHPGCPCTQNSHCVGECNQVSGVCQKLECASGNTINCACQKPSDCVEDQECLNKICVHSAKTCSRKPLSPSCPCTDSIFCASKYCVKGGCKKCNETARDLNCDCDTSDDCRSPLGCDETSYSCQHDCKQAGSSPGCPCGAPRSCLTLNCAKDSKCDACGNSSAAGCSCKAVNQCGIGLTCQNNVCKQECKSKPLSPSCSCSDSADCASKSCYLDKCGKCSSFPLPPKCVCSQINDCRTTCDPYSGFCADFCDGGVCRQGLNCVDTVKGPVCLSETHCNQQLLPPDCPCHKNNTRPCASERCNDKTEKCEPCTMPASEGCPCASPGQCKSNHLCAMGMFYQICTKMCTVEPYPPTCDCDSDKKCLSGNCASFMCQMCQSGSKLQNCNCQSNSDCPKGLECISGICQQRQCSIYPKYTLNCPCTSAAQCTSGICSLGKCHRGDECAITMGAQGKKKCPPGKVCDDGICVTCFPKKSTGCSCKHPSECPGYCDTITEKCQTSVFCSNATSGNDGCQCECGKPTCKNTCVKIGIFCKCMDCSTVLKSQYCPCKDNTDCESKSCQKSQCVPKIKVCSATRKPPTCPCKEHTDCNDGKCQSNVCVECDDRVPRSLGCPCLEDPHCSDGKCYALLDGSKKCINCATSPNSEGCPCQTGCIRSPQGPVQPGQACTSVVKPPGCQCQRPLECTDGHCVRNPNSKDMICGCKPLGVPGCPCALPSDCLDSCVQSSSGLLICGGDCKGASKKIGCQCTSPTECGKGKCEQTNDDPPAFKCLDCSAGSSPKGCPCSGPLSCKGVCANGKCVDCDTKPLAGKCPCQEDVDCVDKCVGGFCSECSVPQAVNCSCDSSSECESGICAPQSTVGVFKCVAKCTQTAERPVGCSCHENEDCIHTCVGSICTNCDLELKPDTCPCMNDFNCVNKCIDNLCTKTPCLTPPFPHGCSCKAAPDCSSGYCVRTHSGFRKCAECGHTSRDDGCGCESDQDCVNECIWSEDKKICACDCPAGQFCHGTNDHNDPLCVCIAGGSCKSKFGFLDLPTWMFVFMIVLILFFIVLCALLVIWRKKHSKYDFQMMESDVSMGDDYDFRG